MGTWLTIPLILLVNSGGFFGKKWIEENIDDGQLDKYFFLLAAIMIVNQVSQSLCHPLSHSATRLGGAVVAIRQCCAVPSLVHFLCIIAA